MKWCLRIMVAVPLLLLGLLLVVPEAQADCRAIVRTYHAPTVYTPTVVHDVVKTVVVKELVPVVVPTYNAYITPLYPAQGYGGYYNGFPQQPPSSDKLTAAVEKLVGLVETQSKRLDRLESLQRPQPDPVVPAPTQPMPQAAPKPMGRADQTGNEALAARALVLQGQFCSRCHDKANAPARGKGIVLTEGSKFAQLSPELLGKVVQQVANGAMPLGGAMTPAQRLEFITAHLGE